MSLRAASEVISLTRKALVRSYSALCCSRNVRAYIGRGSDARKLPG